MSLSNKELMRGNIVCYDGKPRIVKAVSELIMLEGDKNWIGGSLMNGEPITPPWLERLKFQWDELTWSNKNVWLAPNDDAYDVFLHGISGGVSRRISYVHQLQLIYFAMTGEHLILPKLPK